MKYEFYIYCMKFLKSFEKSSTIKRFEVGPEDFPVDSKAKIVSVNTDLVYDYQILFYNNEIYYIYDNEIKRFLTPNEIEDYEIKSKEYKIKSDAEKYNL